MLIQVLLAYFRQLLPFGVCFFYFLATEPIVFAQNSDCEAMLDHAAPFLGRQAIARLPVGSRCRGSGKLPQCVSREGRPIVHFDWKGSAPRGLKLLAFGLMHGDEPVSSELLFDWMARLNGFSPRNTWRIIPVSNPDGLQARSRLNAAGVDLNRNFPTVDWDQESQKYWIKTSKGDKRRNPGSSAASEPETKCYIQHITDFQPDFVVSVHTPYGLLDFDGPTNNRPRLLPLAWKRLGNFPGSLGRYLWKDRAIPVLTIELTAKSLMKDIESWRKFQDDLGTFAIESLGSVNPQEPRH